MALGNNPTQQEVVTEVKRLNNEKYDSSNPSGFITSTTAASTYLKKTGGGITGDLSISRDLSVDGDVEIGGHTTLVGQSNSDITVNLPSSAGTIALTSDIPSTAYAYTRVKDGAGNEYAASSSRNGVMFAGENGLEVVKEDISGDSSAIMMRIRPNSSYKIPTTTEWDSKANAADYLPLSAGSGKPLTGDIYYSGSNRSAVAIRFKPYDVNGTGVIIGDGGLVHIGAGESAGSGNDTTWGYNGGTEDLYLTADGAVFLASNCNTIANRKLITFGTDGSFRPNASGQNLGTVANRWSDLYLSNILVKGATGMAGCSTAAGTAAKEATISNFGSGLSAYSSGSVFVLYISNENTAATALTLNINQLGAKPIYINNAASSSSNYTLKKGWHTFYYNGTNFYTQDYAISGYDGGIAMKGNYQIPVASNAWDLGVSAYRWRNAYLSGQLNTSATTQSTSATTGSIVTKGGIGVAKNIYCSGSIYEGGTLLSSKYSTPPTLLWDASTAWTDVHPSSWSGGNITITTSDYSAFVVLSDNNWANRPYTSSIVWNISGIPQTIGSPFVYNNAACNIGARYVVVQSGYMAFGNGYSLSSGAMTTNQSACIPFKIYGIK